MSLPTRVPGPARTAAADRGDGARGAKVSFTKSLTAWVSLPLVTRRRERQWHAGLPDFAMRLSRDLRTGMPIDQALIDTIESVDAPSVMQSAAARVRAGRPMGEVIARWGHDASTDSERLLVAALAIGLDAGAQLGPVLDGLAVALRDELALDARRRVLLVQAQVSALVLVTMPVGFAVLSSLMRDGFAFSGTLGLVLLLGGLTLDGLGVLWMRRLLRRLR